VTKHGTALGVVALVLLLGGVWWVGSGRSASGVVVAWTPTCTGTELTDLPDLPPSVPGAEPLAGDLAIDLRPGTTCSIVLTITNTSRWSVDLTAVRAPFLGRWGGSEVQALPDPPRPALRPTASEEVDARFALDRELAPGTSTTARIDIGWREDGCNGAGVLTFDGWPSVEFRLLARDHEVDSAQRLVLLTHDGDHVAPAEAGC